MYRSIFLATLIFAHFISFCDDTSLDDEMASVNFKFEVINLTSELTCTISSENSIENESFGLTIGSSTHSATLLPTVNYTISISSPEIGVVQHQVNCNAAFNSTLGIVIEGVNFKSEEVLGVQISYLNSSNQASSKIELNAASNKMKQMMAIKTAEVISKVNFFRTASEIREYISANHLRFEFNENAAVYYLKEKGADIAEASNFKMLVGELNANTSFLTPTNPDMAEAQESNENLEGEPLADTKDIYFSVQLGSFTMEIENPEARFNTNSVISKVKENGTNKYSSGIFNSYDLAVVHKNQLIESGREGAFVVAINNGKRVSLEEALAISKATQMAE